MAPRRLLRVFPRAVVALIIGIGCTLAFAWAPLVLIATGWLGPGPTTSWRDRPLDTTDSKGRVWSMAPRRGFEFWELRAWRLQRERDADRLSFTRTFDPPPAAPPEPTGDERPYATAGFPYPCLKLVYTDSSLTDADGALPLGSKASSLVDLPTILLWRGFATDTALFTAVAFFIFTFIAWRRRVGRRQQLRCAGCAHSVRGVRGACPNCDEPVPPARPARRRIPWGAAAAAVVLAPLCTVTAAWIVDLAISNAGTARKLPLDRTMGRIDGGVELPLAFTVDDGQAHQLRRFGCEWWPVFPPGVRPPGTQIDAGPAPGWVRDAARGHSAGDLLAMGWPWPCLHKFKTPTARGFRPSNPTAFEPSWAPLCFAELPITVRPVGFALDCAFYAAAIFTLLILPGITRRALRRARGRCTCCGYSVKGITGPCPECGELAESKPS